jgi:EAL domain-containing protein (putative c-di-GMP-specific phosphodiesterase class I)/GGDEF domain-containing protein
MMRVRLQGDLGKAAGAAFVAVLILLMGLAALRAQSATRQLHARESVRRDLDVAAAGVASAIAALRANVAALAKDVPRYRAVLEGRADALPGEGRSIWWSNGSAVDFVSAVRFNVPHSEIIAFVGDAASLRVVTTNDGVDVVLMKERVADAGSGVEWLGAGLAVNDLLSAESVGAVLETGTNVALLGASGATVFRTTPIALTDPVRSAVHLGTEQWELLAAPPGSWSDAETDWQTALLVAVLAVGSGLGVWALARKPAVLREQIERLTADLEDKDADLSRLLRSRSQIESQLVTSLTVDLYTGLPNRASFVEHVQARLAKSRTAADGGIFVAAVLLHKLAEVGHSMGATVAEQVMREAAERLQRAGGPEAYLARIGECELALCFGLVDVRDDKGLMERLLNSLEARFIVNQRAIYVPAVAGIAASTDGYNHGPELLSQAALAANVAITEGQRSSVFRLEAKEARISLLQLEADLRSALDSNELRLFFQPIVSVTDGHIVGFESLLRWQHPTESWIGPDRFIPLAESMGQMARISDWVLGQGIAHAKQFSQARQEPLYVTVNLTPRDLNRDMCSRLLELLDTMRLPSQCLRIEITETAVVRDFRIAARLIAELNERGVRVLLDDFGTGYSSLSYLRDLPFHAVKIDKSFIHKMTTQARDFGLVKSIVGLVHYLGMECVAEGVETQEQLDLIAMMNCNYWQGFLFSRPLPASQVEPLIREQRRKTGVALAAS